MRVLPIWVVYQHPLDFPGHYVVRVQWASDTGEVDSAAVACLYSTLEEAMEDCQARGLTWIARLSEDQPHIMGVWI